MTERWGALPLDEVVPQGDGWKAMGRAQSKCCMGCGKVVRLRSEALWFDTFKAQTWHFACRPRGANAPRWRTA